MGLGNGARLNAMKASVQAILDTSYLEDTVAIITFSDTAQSLLANVE